MPPIDRLSRETSATIRHAEVSCPSHHVHSGSTQANLRRYRDFLRKPGQKLRLTASDCPACPGCQYDDIAWARDALQDILMSLPLRARVEFRGLLDVLDSEFRQRTLPDPWRPGLDWLGEPLPWWHRRVYQGR